MCVQIAPTMDEAKALKMYRGPFAELSPPEQFLLVMASVPRLVNKVGDCPPSNSGAGLRKLVWPPKQFLLVIAGVPRLVNKVGPDPTAVVAAPLLRLSASIMHCGGAAHACGALNASPDTRCSEPLNRAYLFVPTGLQVQALIFRRQFDGLCGEVLGGMDTLRRWAACVDRNCWLAMSAALSQVCL